MSQSSRIDLRVVDRLHRRTGRALAGCALVCLLIPSLVPALGQSVEHEFDKTVRSLKVFGADDRQVVGDSTQFPWSAVGLVQSTWRKSDNLVVISTGTGALIGDSIVLTGGHCVYDQDNGWADEILFIPAKNGSSEPFGRSYSVRTIAQRAWVEDKDNRYDLAMIVLDQALGEQASHLTVSAEANEFFVERNLNSSGYPGETKSGDVQYHSFGQSLDVQDGLIRHMIDSEPGQSGSPLWYYEPSTQARRIVGVLTGSREISSGGQVVDSYNVAIHIDSTFAGWIQDTLAKYDSGGAQTIQVSETNETGDPATCGTGLPLAAVMTLGLLPLLRLVAGRRGACY